MTSLHDTPTNQKKRLQLDRAMRELLEEILQQGFHGTAQIVIAVQDGTIQLLRRTVERIER